MSNDTRVCRPASRTGPRSTAEPLEGRLLLSVVRPDHVVVVIEQDRASDAIGNVNFPYLNSLASTGLNFSNAHGVTHPSEPNTLAFYSGSTLGVTDNGRGYAFSGPNLAKSLFDAGLSFAGYVENLPADGSQVQQAGDATHPDLYTRNLNAMAQFTNVGTLATGAPRPNSAVNRTFAAFQSIPTTDYSSLPTVSFVVPNNLHSTHGSNEAYPWAGSADETNNDVLRRSADNWLHDNLDAYFQWAKSHNSLLIVTQDEERWTGGTAQTVTTVVNGDSRLFVAGTNPANVNEYNLLRTLEDMYALPRLNSSATAAPYDTNAQGQLAPSSASTSTVAPTSTSLSSSANPAQSGQSVTLTATVLTSGATTATGTVAFRDGATVLGTAALDASGAASLTTASLAAGSHSLTAAYGGDANFGASTSPALAQTVNAPAAAATSTSLASSANPVVAGKALTFTATVTAASGTGTPSGTVTFRDGSAILGTSTLDTAGKATLTTSSLTVGSNSITAAYNGASGFQPGTSAALAEQVNASTTTPANDNFANRVTLQGPSVTTSGTNVKATKEIGEPKHAGNAGGKSVWWTWIAPASGSVTIDTFGSTFDTLLGVYTGAGVSALAAVASNDDTANTPGGASKVTFTATAGTQYQIAVDGYGGASGSITLHVSQATSTAAVTAAPTGGSAATFSTTSISPTHSKRKTVLA